MIATAIKSRKKGKKESKKPTIDLQIIQSDRLFISYFFYGPNLLSCLKKAMELYGYQFIREIKKFNLDSYIAHLGWVAMGITTIKIYSKFDSLFFYLHDEVQDRLFEFSAEEPKKLKSAEEYNKVVRAYSIFMAHK